MPTEAPPVAPLDIQDTPLEGVRILRPQIWKDARGSFFESWQKPRFDAHGHAAPFVQDNVVTSGRGVLRGLHYQFPRAQLKFISVHHGAVFDVAVDVRAGSPTFGKWFGLELSAENHAQLWIEPGFAHGYQVLSDTAVVSYKCTEVYVPSDDRTLLWSDPQIGIRWPLENPVLSPKDAGARRLAEIPRDQLFVYENRETTNK